MSQEQQPNYPYQQPTGGQWQPQPPAPKTRGRGKFFAIGCGGLLALAIIIGIAVAASSGNGSPSTGTATATTQATQAATQATTAKPAIAPKWMTTHTFTGNGTQKTAIFTAPDDWKILYTCTYQNIGGVTADGALGVTVYGSDNTPLDVAVNATCKNGVAKTTGQTEEHQGGQVYLDMNGTGDWTIQVQELK